MAVCQLSQVTVNQEDIKTSIASYTGSKEFLKKVIPLTITNIVYWRTNVDRKCFDKRTIDKLNFYTFSGTKNNQVGHSVRIWTKAAMQALDLGYLKEMFFIILKQKTGEILEMYKYKISYNPEPNNEQTKASPQQVLNYTIDLFDNIKSTGSSPKLPDDVEFKIELTYIDGTPKEYEPPSFHAVGAQEPYLKSYVEGKTYLKIGSIDTGYHIMRCFGKSNMFNISRPSTPMNITNDSVLEEENEDTTINLNTTNKTVLTLSESNVSSPTRQTDIEMIEDLTNTINCPCTLQVSFDEIPLITCTICHLQQHCACMSYVSGETVPSSYVCVFCGDSGHPMKNDNLLNLSADQRRTICLVRLVLLYSYYNQKVAHSVINCVDSSLQKLIWRKLKSMDIYVYDDIKCQGIKKKSLKSTIKRLFNNGNKENHGISIDSLDLGTNALGTTVDTVEDDSMALAGPKRKKKQV